MGKPAKTTAQKFVPSPDSNFEDLVKFFDKDIKYLIKTKVFNYDSSDVCHTTEDVYQNCLISLLNATKIYKPNKGMKFRTFVIFHISSRLGNFRNKIQRKNAFQTVSMSELNAGWGITGREDNCENSSITATVSPYYQDLVNSLNRGQEALDEIIDVKNLIEKLPKYKKEIFIQYYIEGKKINEICENTPDLKYYQINRHKKHLDKIYKTLIKGDIPCQ